MELEFPSRGLLRQPQLRVPSALTVKEASTHSDNTPDGNEELDPDLQPIEF